MRCFKWKKICLINFIELVEHDLQGTKQMGVREMVIMFLNTIGHEIGNTMIQKRFQHSKEK